MSEQQTDERETLSLTEVADLAGVRPGSVANWRKRHADFPNPEVGPGRNRFFRDEIEQWLERKGKRKKPTKKSTTADLLKSAIKEFDQHLQDKKDEIETSAFNNDVFVYNALRFIVAYTAYRIASNKKEQASAIEEILTEIHVISEDNPNLDFERTLHKLTLPLVDSDPSFSALATATIDVGVNGLDQTKSSISSISAPWITDAAIAQFLALLTKPTKEPTNGVTIYDPCVGFGTTLLYSSALVNNAISVGQDIDPNIVSLASLCLSLRNCNATLSIGDSISGPVPSPPISADVVLADPVLGMKVPPNIETDSRWELGNPKGSLSNAWVQVVLRHLNQTGRGALIVEHDWLNASDKVSVDLRTNLLRRNVLDATITIPKGFFYKFSDSFSILLFDKNREARGMQAADNRVAFFDIPQVQESGQGFAPVFTLVAALYLYAAWREDAQILISQSEPLAFSQAKNRFADEFQATTLQDFATNLAKTIFPSAGLTLDVEGEDIATSFENLQKHFAHATYEEILSNDCSLDPKSFQPSLGHWKPGDGSDLISSLTQRVADISDLVTTVFPPDQKEEGMQNTPTTIRKLKEIADVVYWDTSPNPSYPNPKEKKIQVFMLGIRAWSQFITREGSGQVPENHKELFENQTLPLGRFTAAIERRLSDQKIPATSKGIVAALGQLRDGSANIEPVLTEIQELEKQEKSRSPLVNAGAWALRDFEDWEFLSPENKGKTYLILDPNADLVAEIHTEETVNLKALRKLKPNSAILAFSNELYAEDAFRTFFILQVNEEIPTTSANRSFARAKLTEDFLEIDVLTSDVGSSPINFDSDKPEQIIDHLKYSLKKIRSEVASLVEVVDQLEYFTDNFAAGPRTDLYRKLTIMKDLEDKGDIDGAKRIALQLLGRDLDNGQ